MSDWSSDVCSSELHRINSLIGGHADQMPRHKNIRCHAICLNLHGAAQIAAIHGVVCYAVTNQIAVKGEVGDLMGNAEPPANSGVARSEEHTSQLQSLMRISYAVFCLKQKNKRQMNRSNKP